MSLIGAGEASIYFGIINDITYGSNRAWELGKQRGVIDIIPPS
jgi:hypothetical protein